MLKRSCIVVAGALIAVAACTATPVSAASVATKGTGWKLTSELGVTSASPSKTYTITFGTEAMRKRYTPYLTAAVSQVNAAGLHLRTGGVEANDPSACGPAYHIQFMEMYRPLGTPGWSQAMPCPNQPGGLGRGGLVAIDSEYWDGTWPVKDHVLRNTVVHEMLHALGLDHPNRDIDKDGTVEPGECVATSYGNKPVMCSPNGGYGTTANKGKLLAYDVNGIKQLIANAKAQGLK
ncbi:hypothetical protein HCC61_23525 [Streptomyces sp. HNM0575]|uniref:hypothetical protein n=1 Tax=Streptomyces sp. HNM0575 TaxID=2716338 RepID=UPI00145F3240|nr:hypothetical protein [Streptomyces sp. HNM0575]NLU75594.1 hypothetical protein [Streptomyces sp. HNM0575]